MGRAYCYEHKSRDGKIHVDSSGLKVDGVFIQNPIQLQEFAKAIAEAWKDKERVSIVSEVVPAVIEAAGRLRAQSHTTDEAPHVPPPKDPQELDPPTPA